MKAGVKAGVVCTVLLCMLVGCTGEQVTAQPLPEQVEMYYFYDEICGSCDGTAEFDELAQQALADVKDTYPYVIYRHNIYKETGKQALLELCEELGMDADTLQMPVLIAGGQVFQGHETMGKRLAETYLTAGEDLFVNKVVYNPKYKKTGEHLFDDYKVNKNSVTLVYFYRITCEECGQTKPLVDALSAELEIEGKKVPLDVIRINTRAGNNNERIYAMFESYNVPDVDRMVPIVFTATGYYAGYEAIEKALKQDLAQSGNMLFSFPAG